MSDDESQEPYGAYFVYRGVLRDPEDREMRAP